MSNQNDLDEAFAESNLNYLKLYVTTNGKPPSASDMSMSQIFGRSSTMSEFNASSNFLNPSSHVKHEKINEQAEIP